MTRHVSAEKLARFRDGDLSRSAARRVTAHLARCPACRADADALAELPALLAGTELPRIPDHLAARIETALATESAQRAAAAPQRTAARHGAARRSGLPRWVVTDERARRRAWRSGPAPRILATAAVVAVLGGGGYALVSGLGGSSASSSGASNSRPLAGPPVAPAPRPSAGAGSSGLRAPAVSNGVRPGAVSAPSFGPLEEYRHDGHAASFRPVRTSTDYLTAQLGQQAAATLAAVRSSRPTAAGGTGRNTSAGDGTAGARRGFSTATLARLPGCVARVAAGQSVLLVDLASFQGGPAIIIVTAPPGSATGTQVWAAGPDCSSSGADVLAHKPLP